MAFCTPQSFQRRRIGFDAVMFVILKCVNKKKSGKISMIFLSGNVMYIYISYIFRVLIFKWMSLEEIWKIVLSN